MRRAIHCRWCGRYTGLLGLLWCDPDCFASWSANLENFATSAEARHVIDVAVGSSDHAAKLAAPFVAQVRSEHATKLSALPRGRHCTRCGEPCEKKPSYHGRCDACASVHEDLSDSPAIDALTRWEEDEIAQAVVALNPDGATLEQVGELIGVTRERVRQIEDKALAKLRARAASFGLTASDLAAVLAAKPVGESFPVGIGGPGVGSRRGQRVLSPESLDPSPESARADEALGDLERATGRLRAWLDALDEIDRVKSAQHQEQRLGSLLARAGRR